MPQLPSMKRTIPLRSVPPYLLHNRALTLALQGGNIMLAGIAIQMGMLLQHEYSAVPTHMYMRLIAAASITIYMLLAAEFVLRFLHDKPVRNVVHPSGRHNFTRNVRLMLAGLTFSSVCIYIRYARRASLCHLTILMPVHCCVGLSIEPS